MTAPERAPERVVLDLETTGLSPRRAQVIEVGAVRLDGRRIASTFHAFARPSHPIPEPATSVHGITNEMVAEGPPFEELLPDLLEFVGDRVVAAHHARFDMSFVQAAARRAGLTCRNEVWCTVRLARRLLPEEPRHDLDSLCVAFSIRRSAAHRALPDATATAHLLALLLERAAEEGLTDEDVRRVAAPPRAAAHQPPRAWTAEEGQALENAILTGDRIALGYVSRRGRTAERIVVPYQVHGPGALLLVAYDVAAGRTRTFRLDRVAALRALP